MIIKRADAGMLAVLALAIVLIPLTLGDYWVLTFGTVGAIALAVIGLNVAMGWAGLLSFGQPVFMAVGGYTTALLTVRYSVNPWLALLCGLALSAAVAAVIGFPVLKLESHYFAVATFAMSLISNSATTTTPVLQKMAGADVIFSNTSGPINIIMAKDAATLGLKVPLIFNDPGDCPQIAAAYQPTYCEIPQAQLYPNVANATIKANDGALWDAYKASGGKMINFGSVTAGADQVQLIAKAMTQAGTTDGGAVNTALSSLDYVGAQTEYKFQPGHTFGAANPYVLTSTANNTETVVYQPTAGAAS